MSEEQPAEVTEQKKSPLLKIIVLSLVLLIVLVSAIGGTLFFTGALSKKAPNAEQVLNEHAAEAKPAHDKPAASASSADAQGKDAGAKAGKADAGKADAQGNGGAAAPQIRSIPADTQTKFEKSYMDLDDKKPLVTNITGSRKVVQVSLSLMTQYDERVFKNVEKHRTALRSVALDVLRQITEPELTKAGFRVQLAQQLRDKINLELERLEGFGGIEEIFFAEFVYQ